MRSEARQIEARGRGERSKRARTWGEAQALLLAARDAAQRLSSLPTMTSAHAHMPSPRIRTRECRHLRPSASPSSPWQTTDCNCIFFLRVDCNCR